MVGSQDSQAVLDGGYEAGLSFVGQGVIVRAPLGNDVVRVAELAAQALSVSTRFAHSRARYQIG